jgi:hypothetical protein
MSTKSKPRSHEEIVQAMQENIHYRDAADARHKRYNATDFPHPWVMQAPAYQLYRVGVWYDDPEYGLTLTTLWRPVWTRIKRQPFTSLEEYQDFHRTLIQRRPRQL